MLTIAGAKALLDGLPGERITDAYIRSRITSVSYLNPVGTLTVCVVLLDTGFVVTGESACVDPRNYREDMGHALAYEKAYNRLWELFGFLLAEARYNAANGPDDGVVNVV
jgi:hypothetical protein